MPTIFGKPRVFAIWRPDSDCRPSDGQFGVRLVKLLEKIVWRGELDQTVRPIARSL